jgi:RNA polymerase sigma-70 factor (ECF subfamily)
MTETHKAQFLHLLEEVHTRLWRFAFSITHDETEADDLLSDTVLAAFERFDTLKDPQAFTSFLFTIATRINRHNQDRRRRYDKYDPELAETIPSTNIAPDVAADILLIREALSLLPEKQRETIILFEISGFSLQEIREIQGGTLSGVKSRLRRARKDLAKLLGVPEKTDHQSEIHSVLFRKQVSSVNLPIAMAVHE